MVLPLKIFSYSLWLNVNTNLQIQSILKPFSVQMHYWFCIVVLLQVKQRSTFICSMNTYYLPCPRHCASSWKGGQRTSEQMWPVTEFPVQSRRQILKSHHSFYMVKWALPPGQSGQGNLPVSWPDSSWSPFGTCFFVNPNVKSSLNYFNCWNHWWIHLSFTSFFRTESMVRYCQECAREHMRTLWKGVVGVVIESEQRLYKNRFYLTYWHVHLGEWEGQALPFSWLCDGSNKGSLFHFPKSTF